ncbi:hypothetical protein IKG05_00125 [Candidatus Saccharibacteria bacterium]|nr:hypothetical protein [Candidatus Saccharibacteria bacterium]
MDNQPNSVGQPTPTPPTTTPGTIEPVDGSADRSNGNSVNSPVNATTINPVDLPKTNPDSGDIILEAGKKKRKKGLIIALVSIFAVLLVGGGIFTAFAIIKNQPNNIALSALNNLFTADQVDINGSINIAIPGSEKIGIESVSLNFNEESAGMNNSATATISVDFANNTQTASVGIGEVMLNDGVLYLEATGLKDFYESAIYDSAYEALTYQLGSNYRTALVQDCYTTTTTSEEYSNCYSFYQTNITPEIATSINNVATEILDQISNIIASIDGQWIEISLDDVMSSNLLGDIPVYTRQSVTSAYHCTINTLNQISNYSSELSDLYNQNPFLIMTSAADSFYDISFDATNLAGYLNGLPHTKLSSDLATCTNTTISDTTNPNFTASDIQSVINFLPKISAKFDGFLNHHLTELKLNQQNESYQLSSDLKFTYPKSANISAPTDTRPVMDVIEEIYQAIENLSKSYAS